MYTFTSARLGFRNWETADLHALTAMNADPRVMTYFPKPLTPNESRQFLERMQQQYHQRGHTYFAVELLETRAFIGFIGLSYQGYPSPYTPAVDIGWRLMATAWGHGYATEGAKACLKVGFSHLGLPEVIAVCTPENTPSENVMKKIGMHLKGSFDHPGLLNTALDPKCLCYGITKQEYLQG
ncbi:GNAT family N-acetyltransferase [Robiginitalea sp. M366]|uniref:GNAT family N-acetyltransferase n=1 Tax=Robiginitalea aestuariiviva TaxID=3036903 RepID=UPI00240D92A7|nr:GNAT family N-acetyltransferase [Robiginitalea aestuariiviva]MDG1571935.1 GNAT family N-acetyltransferase [Robiginitalea aestuariiviva]